jgi:probable addiction module antidote protein
MPLETLPFDSAQHLKTQQDIALYLQAVLKENDPALFCHALGQVARAKGMTQLARETGLAREALYRALSAEGNPELATIMKVMKALDIHLSVEPARACG